MSSGVECIRGQNHTTTFLLCLKLSFLDKLTLASHATVTWKTRILEAWCQSALTVFQSLPDPLSSGRACITS